ncbi:hypothetical protein NL676_021564 [Syzygium grande]|nr:hypothetical protein NL676_021564 [Syzygium grande]
MTTPTTTPRRQAGDPSEAAERRTDGWWRARGITTNRWGSEDGLCEENEDARWWHCGRTRVVFVKSAIDSTPSVALCLSPSLCSSVRVSSKKKTNCTLLFRAR